MSGLFYLEINSNLEKYLPEKITINILLFALGSAEHGGVVYSNSIFIPQAKGKTITFKKAYVLNGGTDVTSNINIRNLDGFINITMSYAESFGAIGNIIQLNDVMIS